MEVFFFTSTRCSLRCRRTKPRYATQANALLITFIVRLFLLKLKVFISWLSFLQTKTQFETFSYFLKSAYRNVYSCKRFLPYATG